MDIETFMTMSNFFYNFARRVKYISCQFQLETYTKENSKSYMESILISWYKRCFFSSQIMGLILTCNDSEQKSEVLRGH